MKQGLNLICSADNRDGTYTNPVIHADYSDPDAIRVGDDFYMAASSFNVVPGVPVLHSKDLVNWRIINHVIKRIPFGEYDLPRHGCGAWAPAIRFHAGKYFVFIPMPDEGVFMSQTDDPAGEWSDLVCVRQGKGWIDPCPFWDDDGQAYMVNAFANSRIGIKSILHISRMKPDGTGLLDDGVHVFDGTKNHPTIEGPKLYKRNGWYYIFAPAGGVPRGWQTVLRSRSIWGPYEDKIVLHQGNTDINGPHQGAWIELENNESWFLHFQDKEAYGRILHLQPMRWENDWPVIGIDQNKDGVGEPVMRYRKPDVGKAFSVCAPATSDDFASPTLGLQWQWEANPGPEWYSLEANPGHLRLFSGKMVRGGVGLIRNYPRLLGQKFPALSFKATTKLCLHSKAGGELAGLAIIGDAWAWLAISNTGPTSRLLYCHNESGKQDSEKTISLADVASGTIFLSAEVDENAVCCFSYSLDGNEYISVDHKFAAMPGRWVGARVGIFSGNPTDVQGAGYADFEYFTVEGK